MHALKHIKVDPFYLRSFERYDCFYKQQIFTHFLYPLFYHSIFNIF